MSDIHRIVKNTTVLFATDMCNKALGFFYVAAMVRYLGNNNFGIITYAIALVTLLSFFSDIGLSSLITRDVARDKSAASRYVNNVIGAKIPLNIFTFAIIAIAASIGGYDPQGIMIILMIGLSTIISSFYGVFNSVFQANEKMEYQSLGQVLNNAVLLAGALLSIWLNMGIIAFAAMYLIASIVTALYEIIVYAWKFEIPGIRFDWAFIIPALKESLPFGLTGSFITIYYMVSSVLLKIMVNTEQVGWYNAAFKLVQFLGFLPAILFGALYPVSSRLFKSSKESLKFLFERSFKYLLIFAVPLGVGTTVLARQFIVLIYAGKAYTPTDIANTTLALQILIWSEVVLFLSMALANLLNSTNMQAVITKQTALSAVVNVALNIIVIPFYGFVGACVVTVITEAIALGFLYTAVMRSEFRIPGRTAVDVVKVLIASCIMGAFVYMFQSYNLFVVIVLAIAIYFAAIILARVLDDADIGMAKQILFGWRKSLEDFTGSRE